MRSPTGESGSVKSEYTEEDIGVLMDLLHRIWQKWRRIGNAFHIPNWMLDRIETDKRGNTSDCMCAVINEQLRQKGCILSSELSDILRSPSIGETTLANKFCTDNSTFTQSRETHKSITKINVLHCIKPNIFETVFPYTYMKKTASFSHGIFGVYVLLQFVSVLGDGALQPNKYTYDQYPNRVAFLLLHAILMIGFPCACYAQWCWLSSLEEKYLTSEKLSPVTKSTDSELEMENILTKRKISFNPLDFIEQVSFLRKCKLKQLDFNCFQVPMHAVIYPCLLYWLGVFSDVPSSTSWIHTELWDCFAVGIGLVFTGIVKDIYCIENYVATILVDSDNNQNNQSRDIFRAIRHRWLAWDTFIHILAVVFLVLILILYYFGEPFTKSQETPANDDLRYKWILLTFLLIIMQASGSSANATTKKICMISYILLPLLMYVFAYIDDGIVTFDQIRNGFYFYKATGHIYLILFTTQLVTILNWLLCLQRCYWRQLYKQYLSWKYHGLCVAALGIVILCLSFVLIVEFQNFYGRKSIHFLYMSIK